MGGVSQLVLGASQFFAGAFLATDPPPRSLVRAQLILWNLGTIALAVAVPTGASFLLWGAVAFLVSGLGLWLLAVSTMRRRSLSNAPWATRWYLTCVGFFAAGMIVGSLIADGVIWTHGFLLGAHMTLNLAGFFGTAIVGTLHTFYPSLTQTQLRFPRLQSLSFSTWTFGVSALAVGYAWSLDGLAVTGWIALSAGAVLMLVNLIDCRRRAAGELSLAARVVGAAQPFLLAGLILISATAIIDGPALAFSGSTRIAAGTLLVVGWIGLTVVGSLLHLLAVVVRVRRFSEPMPKARPRSDSVVAAFAVGSVAFLAVSQLAGPDDLDQIARIAVLALYAYLGARVAVLASRVLRRARPNI
ncbi:MAG: hypothetical protein JJE13_05480 [Thermoleophilia bacterium]|nr:hypothetical protein [Thermoleophilia bacterium]